MWRHYVYLHRRNDTGEVFYVGKGSSRTRSKRICYERAQIAHKNPVWRRVIAKAGGFSVEIVAHFATDPDAQAHEKVLIAKYGRRDLGCGSLVNFTDGGDGHCGIVVSDALRAKRSANSRGPRSEAWVKSIRASRKNGGNGGVVKKGDKLPDAWREAIAKGQRGPNNYMRGRCGALSPVGREVVNTDTGERWPTVEAAASAHGLKMKTLYNKLSGHRANDLPLRFAA